MKLKIKLDKIKMEMDDISIPQKKFDFLLHSVPNNMFSYA